MSTYSSTISKPSIVSFAAFIIVISGLMYAESFINPLLMAFFASIICAQPLIWLKNKKVPGGLALLLVIGAIVLVFFGLFQIVSASLSNFANESPIYAQRFSDLSQFVLKYFDDKGLPLASLNDSGVLDPSKIMKFTAGIFGQLSETMSRGMTFIFFTVFLLVEVDSIGLKKKAIAKYADASDAYLEKIGSDIRNYLTIKTLTSLMTGVIIGISLAIIGVDYVILWALIAFLFNYIPTIGSIIAAVPAVLFAALQLGFPAAVGALIVYLIANVLIGSIIEPRIMGKGLGISTFIIFFSLIFWGFVLGPVGMFLSVPIMIALKIMLEHNPKTKWAAILLGTETDAKAVIDEEKSIHNLS